MSAAKDSRALLLGIDVGTTNCKAAAIDPCGNVVAEGISDYTTYYPRHGWAEQQAEDWIAALDRALLVLSRELGDRGRDIVGAALSAHGPALVLADAEGRSLAPSPTWQDHRSQPQGERLLREVGLQWIGMGPPRTGLPAKLLWAKENWPEAFHNCAWAGGVKTHVAFWLTGQLGTDPSSGPGGKVWPEEVFAWIGFPISKLPPVIGPTERIGFLRNDLAARYGFPRGMPVYAGLNDGASSTLGAGAIHPGDACISLGTNGVGRLVTDNPLAPQSALPLDAFFWPYVPGTWVIGGMTLAGGSCLSWLGDVLRRRIDDLLQEAEESPPGCNGVIFLPYLAGRGTPFPMATARGAFLNLSSATGTKDLIRSVLEGVAFAIKDIFQGFAQLGFEVREAYITGGAAKAALWRRIVSDVLERPLRWAAGDATLGAAILASVGSEIHPDIPTAVKAMVRTRERVEPVPETSSCYREIYAEYFRLGKSLGYLSKPEGALEERADGCVHLCGY